jgi:hypothetical protein
MVARFVSAQLGCTLPLPEGSDIRFRFRSQRIGSFRRNIMLTFEQTAILHVGRLSIELSELIEWRGDQILIDRHGLEGVAREAPDTQSGGKGHQPSKAVQQENAIETEIRNRRWQRKADRLHELHPKWNKLRIAKEIRKSSDAEVEPTTIARIIRVPKK